MTQLAIRTVQKHPSVISAMQKTQEKLLVQLSDTIGQKRHVQSPRHVRIAAKHKEQQRHTIMRVQHVQIPRHVRIAVIHQAQRLVISTELGTFLKRQLARMTV